MMAAVVKVTRSRVTASGNRGYGMREKKLKEIEAIADTIREIVIPGMKPKGLIEAVRARHPEASKKEVARAAFLAVIHSAEFTPEDTQALHDMAMDARDVDQT